MRFTFQIFCNLLKLMAAPQKSLHPSRRCTASQRQVARFAEVSRVQLGFLYWNCHTSVQPWLQFESKLERTTQLCRASHSSQLRAQHKPGPGTGSADAAQLTSRWQWAARQGTWTTARCCAGWSGSAEIKRENIRA